MIDFIKELDRYGLTQEVYEQAIDEIDRKLDGDSDLDWSEIKEKFGIECNFDTIRKASNTIFGGKFRTEYLKSKILTGDIGSQLLEESEIDKKIEELRKERIKLSDARTDYNRLVRREARKESYAEMVQKSISENIKPIDLKISYPSYDSDNDLLIHLTDIHTGIEIHNWKNDFDEDVLKRRFEKYTSEIIKIGKRHKSQNAYIVIGEILSGIIHSNLRLQNNLDLIEQFKYASELISQMLCKLAKEFESIYVYVTPGNHSRITPKKEDALDGENMDYLLPFYLKARLQNIQNVFIADNSIEKEIAMFNIRGNNIFAAHGDKDSPSKVVQDFTLLFGIKPHIVLLGHRHTNGLLTVADTKVVQSGCCSGTDQYAISIRRANRPEQTVSVIDTSGLVCLYDIQIDC